MFTASIKPREKQWIMRIDYSEHTSMIDKSVKTYTSKVFEDQDTAEMYLISCAIAFVNLSFESYMLRLKTIAPQVFHSHEYRNMQFMESYWKALEMRDTYFAPCKSPFARIKYILSNIDLLAMTIPKGTNFQDIMSENLRDIIKVSMMLDRYFEPIVVAQRLEWLNITDQEVENEFKNVA